MIRSILIVNQRGRDVKVGKVKAMYRFIKQIVAPLITKERAIALGGRRELLAAIIVKNIALFLEL